MFKNLLKYPTRKVVPKDGMAVTASIWAEAHDYHADRQRFHDLFEHGSGIVFGLEVAPLEQDLSVSVSPGMAIDPQGNMIVLQEAFTANFSSIAGLHYLVLLHNEIDDDANHKISIGRVQASPRMLDAPCIELARVTLASNDRRLRNAARPDAPGRNELDLRFRLESLTRSEGLGGPLRIGVYTTGDVEEGHGASALAVAMRSAGRRVLVDSEIDLESSAAGVSIEARLDAYAIISVVITDPAPLLPAEINNLKEYMRRGGVVLVEACRKKGAANNPAVENLARALGAPLAPLRKGHPLLSLPHRFGDAPPGFETEGDAPVTAGDGLIVSLKDYGCLWTGERRGRLATREEIRAAEEWGENLLEYARARRKEAQR